MPKSLEGYLETKRDRFPRFYFVSNPVLLQILSQGSDPLAIQPFYEKVFDSIGQVEHEKDPGNVKTNGVNPNKISCNDKSERKR